jgi:peptide/nickel transport system substrate-binding protein
MIARRAALKALYSRLLIPLPTLVATLLASCASPVVDSGSEAARAPAPSRTLAVAIRVEPPTVAVRPLQTAGIGLYLPSRMFNASLGVLDNSGQTHPYLVEKLPELNSDTWRVFPDGRMETTYSLKPNLTWHDGTPFSAADFVFGWRVYSTPALGASRASPFRDIEEVTAPDDRTVVIHWRHVYADAFFSSSLQTEFPALPRHLLDEYFHPEQLEPFVNHPFWTREYVGLGPYRLSQWEPGAFIEGVAFDRHVLGRPKIDRIRLDFASDARTVLARILSGEVQMTDGTSAGLPEVAVLKQDWIPQGKGDVIIHPNQWRAVHFQNRPDLANPKILLNRTVRKAIAHAVDKAALNDALYYGLAIPTDSLVAPSSVWGAAAERAATKYPYDLQRTEQLMSEVGFRRGGDGTYTVSGGRLSWLTQTNAGQDNEAEMSILASGWRQAGFDVQESVLSAAEARDPEKRSTFPATFSNSQNCCGSALLGFTSATISTPEARWSGANRSGWSNGEYDRLAEGFSRTLQPAEQQQQVGDMVRLMTGDMQSISLLIRGQPWVYVSELKGIGLAPPEGNVSWNIHEWELR